MYTVVTGGAGFIGSVFVAKLNELGIDEVIIVDDLGSAEKWKNLRGKSFHDYLHKDEFLRRIEDHSFDNSLRAIVHLGACSATTELDLEYLMRNNFQYTKTLAEYATRNQIRFVYASSAATYGRGEHGHSDEHSVVPKLRPLNGYGFSKQLFDSWAFSHGLLDVIAGVKFFNVFGPNEYHKGDMRSVVHKAWGEIKQTGKMKLFRSNSPDFKDGEQQRDFVYVRDCAEVLWQLLDHQNVSGIFNLGTGTARSWNDLVAAVSRALNVPVKIEYVDLPAHLTNQYQNFTQASMKKLSDAGCAVPFRSLEDSVADYVGNFLEKTDPYL